MSSSAFDASGSWPYQPAPAAMLGDASMLYRDFLYAGDRLTGYLGPRFDDDASIVHLNGCPVRDGIPVLLLDEARHRST